MQFACRISPYPPKQKPSKHLSETNVISRKGQNVQVSHGQNFESFTGRVVVMDPYLFMYNAKLDLLFVANIHCAFILK